MLMGFNEYAKSASTLKVGLAAFYEFESGALGTDALGTSNMSNGVGTPTSASTAPTKVGNYGNFVRASSQSLAVADNATINCGNSSVSVSTWVFPATGLANGSEIITKAGSFGDFEFRLSVPFSGGFIPTFTVYKSGTTVDVSAAWGSPLTLDTNWYHIVATYDNSSHVASIIVDNGTPVTTAPGTGTIVTGHTAPLGIGFQGSEYWNGRIDQTGLWKKVLSAAEITQLNNGGNGLSYAAM